MATRCINTWTKPTSSNAQNERITAKISSGNDSIFSMNSIQNLPAMICDLIELEHWCTARNVSVNIGRGMAKWLSRVCVLSILNIKCAVIIQLVISVFRTKWTELFCYRDSVEKLKPEKVHHLILPSQIHEGWKTNEKCVYDERDDGIQLCDASNPQRG